MAQAARQWRRAIDKELEPYDLTEATWLPLVHVARAAEPICQKDLAASLNLDNSSVVRLLDNLQSSGLIERREGKDRRTKLIHLTQAGSETVERVEGSVRIVRDRAVSALSSKEIAEASDVLEKVIKSLSTAN
ncbi:MULTISPECIES: MarR family winged helix-turn-helix transcriptional regulator [Sphingobium]|uniref:MarR family winged helix-turn-helix transcriptional regulator n=1 Tax=Sphingobium TaxID=165695 RepID=UPI001ABEEA88|nr:MULTISPECIES: MarR family transcriptional regulator [Sphingobium]